MVQTSAIPLDKRGRPIDSAVFPKVVVRCALNRMLLDPVSRVTGIPGWYWILGIKCSDITGVRLYTEIVSSSLRKGRRPFFSVLDPAAKGDSFTEVQAVRKEKNMEYIIK